MPGAFSLEATSPERMSRISYALAPAACFRLASAGFLRAVFSISSEPSCLLNAHSRSVAQNVVRYWLMLSGSTAVMGHVNIFVSYIFQKQATVFNGTRLKANPNEAAYKYLELTI